MKDLLLLAVICGFLTVSTTAAQEPGDTLWTHVYGEGDGWFMQQTDEGGYIIASGDLNLLKIDVNGDSVWTRNYDGMNTRSVDQTTDGGYIVVGRRDLDIYLVKTDANGDTLWTRTYEGGDDWYYANSVKQTNDGGFIIGGGICHNGTDHHDAYLLKTDSIGDTVWTRTFAGDDHYWFKSVALAADGGYVAAGVADWQGGGSGGGDAYLVKTDEGGDILWTNTYGGAEKEWVHSVDQTVDGGYIIGGASASYGSVYKVGYLVKTDDEGNELWYRTYFYGISGNNVIYSVRETSDGGYIFCAAFDGYSLERDAWFVKTDSVGDVIWETSCFSFYDDISPMCILQNDDGDYISCGSLGYFIWVVKLAGVPLGIEYNPAPLPAQFALNGNCPNPFNSQTNICFDIPVAGHVDLEIYNVLGRKVETLVDDHMQAGNHNLNWDATLLPRGIYFCRLVVGDISETRRMMLIE